MREELRRFLEEGTTPPLFDHHRRHFTRKTGQPSYGAPRLEEVCRGDAQWYFVDADSNYGAFPTAFRGALKSALDLWLHERHCDLTDRNLFSCPDPNDPIGCFAQTGVEAHVIDVLPQRIGAPGGRGDGHLRFYRIAFSARQTTATLDVRSEAHCTVMAAIKKETDALKGGARPRMGREWCAVQGSEIDWGDGHRLSGGQVNRRASWHLRQLGLERADGSPSWPLLSGPTIPATRLALLDTGVSPAVTTPAALVPIVEGSPSPLLADPPNRTAEHTHGSAMAVLARTVAGPIKIYNLPVLDKNGFGSVSALARGIDRALFELPSSASYEPLVLNMSLGFPPELEAGATLACSSPVPQDGIVEPLRYLLRVARKMDTASRPILAIAAAGNRLHRDGAPAPFPWFDDPNASSSPKAATALFYPAGLSEPDKKCDEIFCGSDRRQCAAEHPERGRLVVAVDAVDSRGRPWALSTQSSASGLVAPGVTVYPFPYDPLLSHLDPYAWPGALTAPYCGGAIEPGDPIPSGYGTFGYSRPTAHSGSSLAAIITSATAVAAFSRMEQPGSPRLSGLGMARLIDLLAVDPETGSKRPQRNKRVCSSRVFAAAAMFTPALAACFNDTNEVDWPNSPCRNAFSDLTASCPPAEQPSFPATMTWPSCYSREDGLDKWKDGLELDDLTLLTTHEAGVLGPQPNDPTCAPPCTDDFNVSERAMTLHISLTEELDPGTVLSKPTLVINQGVQTWSIDLTMGWSEPEHWYPGSTLSISRLPAPDGFDWGDVKSTEVLLAIVVLQDDVETLSFSPMEVILTE